MVREGGRDGGDPLWRSGSALSSRFSTLTQLPITLNVLKQFVYQTDRDRDVMSGRDEWR